MAFIASLFQTIIKMAVVGAVAFGGIILGKKLKDIIKVPVVKDGFLSSWAQYTLICESRTQRNFLQEELKKEAGK